MRLETGVFSLGAAPSREEPERLGPSVTEAEGVAVKTPYQVPLSQNLPEAVERSGGDPEERFLARDPWRPSLDHRVPSVSAKLC